MPKMHIPALGCEMLEHAQHTVTLVSTSRHKMKPGFRLSLNVSVCVKYVCLALIFVRQVGRQAGRQAGGPDESATHPWIARNTL